MTDKLKKHIEHSKNAASANKAKGNKHVEILSSLYNNPARFIEEILQNTEDAYNNLNDFSSEPEVVFELTTESLIVKHNAKVFDEDDLIAITTIGLSTKTQFNDVNMIGKFGLGFKSVYSVCENPKIHSDNFHFEIQDFEVLHKIEEVKDENFNTLIILPLKKDKTIFNFILQALCDISFSKLLFCNLLNKISIQTPDRNFQISKNKTFEFDEFNAIYCFKNSYTNETKDFVISKLLQNNILKFAAAFCVEYDSDLSKVEFISQDVKSLFVYFETLESCSLDFYLHANFTTTPTREHIPFCSLKSPENLILLDELSVWFHNLILNFKKHRILNSDLWAIMPIFSENKVSTQSPVIKSITQGLLSVISNKKVLPSRNSDLHFAKDLIIDKTHKLSNLLISKDIDLLFNRKEILDYSLASKIPDYIIKESSFKQLKLVDIHDFAFAIANNIEYFKRKSFEQHKEFLKLVFSEHSLWSELKKDSYFSLREKAFILCNDNKVYAPFLNSKPQIYRYSSSRKNILMVHRLFEFDDEIQEFFKILGLPNPNTNKEFFSKILPVFVDVNVSRLKLYRAWLALFFNFQSLDNSDKNEIIDNVKVLKCLPVISSQKKNFQFALCSDSYLLNDKISTFFDTSNFFFIDNSLIDLMLKNKISIKEIEVFFCQFGVNLLPAIKKVNLPPDADVLLKLNQDIENKGLKRISTEVEDFTIDGLDSFFKNPSLSKSVVLAELLSAKYPLAKVTLHTYTQYFEQSYEPEFIKLLKTNKWIYDSDSKLCDANETFEINPTYFENDVDIEKLRNVFGFRFADSKISDIERQLLKAIRELKPDFESISKLTLQLVSNKNETLSNPVLIELNTNNSNIELAENKNFAELNDFSNLKFLSEIFAATEFGNRLHNQKAKEIVYSLLKPKFFTNEAEIVFDDSFFGFKLFISKELKEIVLVSGEKTLASEFVFKNIDFKQFGNELNVRYIAVDNLSTEQQIIYSYLVEKENILKLRNDFVLFKPL